MDYQSSYDRVADEYTRRIFDELQHKPLDRQLLDRFAATVRDRGPACDIGTGPGHVAQYLHQRGLQVTGIDLSPAMIQRAKALVPGVEFEQGNMQSLAAPDHAYAGLTAFYCLIHIPPESLTPTLLELRRVLQPAGTLLLAFHLGEGSLHLDEWWGQKVNLDFFLFRSDQMAGHLRAANFEIEEIIERDPYPIIEYPSRRSYIFAKRR